MTGNIAHDPKTGQTYIWNDDAQQYVPANAAERRVISEGAAGDAMAFVEGATGIPGMFNPEYGRALGEVNQNAQTAGFAAAGLSAVGGLAQGALALGRNRMAGRVQQRIAEGVGEIDSQLTPGLASRANLGQNTMLGRAVDQVEGVAESIPVLGLFEAGRLAKNQRIINMRFAEAAGASSDEVVKAAQGLDEGVFRSIQKRFQSDFNQVADDITAGVDQVAARAQMQESLETVVTNNRLRDALQGSQAVTGKQIQNLRSELTDMLRMNQNKEVRDRIMDQIDALDDIIEDALQGTNSQQLYADARGRYRLWANARKGAAIGKNGNINVASMYNNMSKRTGYGDNFLSGNEVAGATPEVNRFLATIREANQIGHRPFDPRAATRSTLLGVGGLAATGYALGD